MKQIKNNQQMMVRLIIEKIKSFIKSYQNKTTDIHQVKKNRINHDLFRKMLRNLKRRSQIEMKCKEDFNNITYLLAICQILIDLINTLQKDFKIYKILSNKQIKLKKEGKFNLYLIIFEKRHS